MKILVVHARYRSEAPSGENRVVDEESSLLESAGHTVERFERHSDDIAGWSAGRRAALALTSVRNSEVRRALEARLVANRPDLVHVHNTFPTLSPSVLAACRAQGIPVVATIHNYKLLCASGDFFRDGRPCHECAGGAFLPAVRHGCYRGSAVTTAPVTLGLAANRGSWRDLVSAYVFISESQRRLMSGLDLPTERTFVKHNFAADVAVPSDSREHVISYVGRLDDAKGVRLLMRSWDEFRGIRPGSSLRLRIVGGGPLAQVVDNWSQDRDEVDVLGHVGPDDARRALASAAAVVVPSEWEETFGLVAVEAMAAGVAPIAPARGSFPELITPGTDGRLFSPGDPGSLAAVFDEVDRAPDAFAELGRAGRDTWGRRFRPEVGLSRLLEIYRFAVLNPRRPGGRAAQASPPPEAAPFPNPG